MSGRSRLSFLLCCESARATEHRIRPSGSDTPGSGLTVVNVTTSYPWGSTLNVSIAAPAPFTFAFRVPAWATDASVDGKRIGIDRNGTLHRVHVAAVGCPFFRAARSRSSSSRRSAQAVLCFGYP